MKPQQILEQLAALRKAAFTKGVSPNTWRRAEKILDRANSKASQNKKACRSWKEKDE